MSDVARFIGIVGLMVFTLLGLAFSIEMVVNLVDEGRRRSSLPRS